MIITFVMDQFGETNNGTTMTAMRFAERLRQKGHEVRVLTASKVEGEGIYVLPELKIPFFQGIIRKQGMKLAKPDKPLMRKAIEGSDVVHLMMPFWAENAAADIAEELNVAVTAAFHVQPENFTYSLHMSKFPGANKLMYTMFRRKFYDRFNHIHCPSEMMKSLLIKNKYCGNIHAISNGVSENFVKREVPRPPEYDGKYVILMTGRYSREKRQDLIIKAIANSKYNDRIQLVLAGKGPTKKKLQRLSRKYLKNPAEFVFLQQDKLIDLINVCDLYVHASDAESEAISCIEAFTCGLVPVISNSDVCATKQFALSEHNLFECGNYKSLCEQIEWFIEHPQEKAELSGKYMEYAKRYAIDNCVDRLIEVFGQAIAENAQMLANKQKEAEYLNTLTSAERRRYLASKKKYVKTCSRNKHPDVTSNYITQIRRVNGDCI